MTKPHMAISTSLYVNMEKKVIIQMNNLILPVKCNKNTIILSYDSVLNFKNLNSRPYLAALLSFLSQYERSNYKCLSPLFVYEIEYQSSYCALIKAITKTEVWIQIMLLFFSTF